MKRLFSSASLILLLVALAQLAHAQTPPRESRIVITSQAPIPGFRSSNNGDTFSVVVVAPVLPSTESDLAANGFNDLQVSQEGGNLVVSFRLLNNATARVVHNSNRLEIIIRSADQARTDVPRAVDSPSSGEAQTTGGEPRRTVNDDGALGDGASSSLQPAVNNSSNKSFETCIVPVLNHELIINSAITRLIFLLFESYNCPALIIA